MEPQIVPSIIAEDQAELDRMLDRLMGKATRIMLDIMDGEFVDNTSLDFDLQLPRGEFEFEAHLMTVRPLEWIEKYGDRVHYAILQVETLNDVEGAIHTVRGRGLKVFLALNPETPLDSIMEYLDALDGVLILTVHPGSFCVEFLPEVLAKVRKLRQLRPDLPIEVDGCMNPDHIELASRAGANIFDSGSYVTKSDDIEKSIEKLRQAALRAS